MEMLRLLKELEDLIIAQKSLLGVTLNYHAEEFLDLVNKIRATMLPPSSPERILDTTASILGKHLRSQEEVEAIRVGLEDCNSGRVRPFSEFMMQMQVKYHMPPHLSDEELYAGGK